MVHSRHRSRAWGAVVLAALWLAASAIPARAGEYDPQEAGHPLRVIAYVLHPVGVALDYLIFRPAYWLGSKEPLRTIFGVDEEFSSDDEDVGGTAPATARPPEEPVQNASPSPQGAKK